MALYPGGTAGGGGNVLEVKIKRQGSGSFNAVYTTISNTEHKFKTVTALTIPGGTNLSVNGSNISQGRSYDCSGDSTIVIIFNCTIGAEAVLKLS